MTKNEKCSCGCGEDLEEENCKCNHDCECGEDCNCTDECRCGDECDCECGEDCGCDHVCNCEENKEYLKDMLRIQAEFDNYRKRMSTALGDARNDGFMDAIEQFLPALDSFKMATDMITDKNTLMGIKFIEKGILDTLAKMGVDEIDTTGKFDPEFHQAIDTEDNEDFESGDIIKVASKGFTYKGKVIRYSQVIVKK
jgi:molecular chaperone GrpE